MGVTWVTSYTYVYVLVLQLTWNQSSCLLWYSITFLLNKHARPDTTATRNNRPMISGIVMVEDPPQSTQNLLTTSREKLASHREQSWPWEIHTQEASWEGR